MYIYNEHLHAMRYIKLVYDKQQSDVTLMYNIQSFRVRVLPKKSCFWHIVALWYLTIIITIHGSVTSKVIRFTGIELVNHWSRAEIYKLLKNTKRQLYNRFLNYRCNECMNHRFSSFTRNLRGSAGTTMVNIQFSNKRKRPLNVTLSQFSIGAGHKAFHLAANPYR